MTASIPTGSAITWDGIDIEMEEAFTLALSLGVGVAYHPNAGFEPSVTAGLHIGEFWDQGQRLANLESLYKAVRPILSVVATLQLIPQQWRIVIGAFLAALDALIANQQQKAA